MLKVSHKHPTSLASTVRIFAVSFLSTSLLLALIVTARAFAAQCGDVQTSIDFQCDGTTDSISSILLYIISFLAAGVGIAVVGGIAWGGLTYARSDGDAGVAKEGREIITNSIIGLVLFIFLYAGANFFIPGGAFNANKPVASTPSGTGSSSTKSSGTKSSGTSSGTGSSTSSGSGSTSSGSSPGGSSTATSIPTFSKINNFRDAGATGGIRQGVLFRSARLYSATASDISSLSTLMSGGLIIDLRDSGARASFPDKSIPNTTRLNAPMTSTTNLGTFVTNGADRTSVAKVIIAIANADGPVLVHCTMGRDRTGWVIAMVMHIAGASDKQIMADFVKTSGVPASRLTAGLNKAISTYGSVDRYITNGLGLTSSTLNAIRTKLKA